MTTARHPRYEPRDIPARAAVYSVGGLFGLIALAAIVVAVLFQIWPAAPRAPAKPNVPAPRLESQEGQDRPAIDDAARKKLEGYGWSDRAAGKAHIPIDRAMELLVQQGWSR
ncbi:MAG TPA: hypothetical protein VFE73_11275 [Reyranella sp.]|jgi:hypothetical protein|nr:hypothetical protein [Reyranella sp.]